MRARGIIGLIVLLAVMVAGNAYAAGTLSVPAGAKIIFLGDSIFKGWGFGHYDDPSPLCRIQDISSLLMQANLSSSPQIVRLEAIPDTEANVQYYSANPDQLLKDRILDGTVGPNDVVIYEDAGPNGANYSSYRQKLGKIAQEAAGANRKIYFMTMFDYNPPLAQSTYDTPTTDQPTKTINDAIRDEAALRGVPVIDMNTCMDRLQAYVTLHHSGSTCFPDGIHPNVFGNLLMSLSIMRTLGADVSSWNLAPVASRYMHTTSGGDIPALTSAPWSWSQDPTDKQRTNLLKQIQQIASGIIDIAVANPSFEEGDAGHSGVEGWTLPGWELGRNGGLGGKQQISVGEQWQELSDGSSAFFYNGFFEITQLTPAVIHEGSKYSLKVDLGKRADFANTWDTFTLSFYAMNPGDSSPVLLAAKVIDANNVPGGSWYTAELNYSATDPSVYGKRLMIKLENPSSGLQPWVDNVRLSEAGPRYSVTLENPAFEEGSVGNSGIAEWTLPGWNLQNNGGLAGKHLITVDGVQWDSLSNGPGAFFYNGTFEITQLTNCSIELGATYALQVDLGQRKDFADTWSSFALSLYAKGTTDANPVLLKGQQFSIANVPQGGWYTAELVCLVNDPAMVGKNLFIKLENPGGLQPSIDNVRLLSSVPLPPANSISVANYSFELGSDGHTGTAGYTIPGWEFGFNGGLAGKYDISSWPGLNPATDGKCAFFYNGSFEITQLTPGVIKAGNIYTLQVDVAKRSDLTHTFPAIGLALYAKAPSDTQLTYLGGDLCAASLVPPGGWYTARTVYVASNPAVYGKNLYIKIENPGGQQPWIDNVRLTYDPIPAPISMGNARNSANGALVNTSGIVTAWYEDYFYIESPDRSCGIRIEDLTSQYLEIGDVVNVVGLIGTLSTGERYIYSRSMSSSAGNDLITPVGVTNKSLGGDGLSSVGLLVRTSGKVIESNIDYVDNWIAIDDGSGDIVRVSLPLFTYLLVEPGQYVTVTGINSPYIAGDQSVQRRILTTWYEDVQILQ